MGTLTLRQLLASLLLVVAVDPAVAQAPPAPAPPPPVPKPEPAPYAEDAKDIERRDRLRPKAVKPKAAEEISTHGQSSTK